MAIDGRDLTIVRLQEQIDALKNAVPSAAPPVLANNAANPANPVSNWSYRPSNQYAQFAGYGRNTPMYGRNPLGPFIPKNQATSRPTAASLLSALGASTPQAHARGGKIAPPPDIYEASRRVSDEQNDERNKAQLAILVKALQGENILKPYTAPENRKDNFPLPPPRKPPVPGSSGNLSLEELLSESNGPHRDMYIRDRAKLRPLEERYAEGGSVTDILQVLSGLGLGRSPMASGGPVMGNGGGQDDTVYTRSNVGSFIIPADVVADLGDGNTEEGHRRLGDMWGRVGMACGGRVRYAKGGSVGSVPVALSAGEHEVPQEIVTAIGNGSNKAGANKLLTMIDRVRKHKATKKHPPMAKSPLSYMKKA